MFVFSLAPAVAPVIGGWVHVALGWRWVFGMLVVMGAALVLVCALLLPRRIRRRSARAFMPVNSRALAGGSRFKPAFFLLAVSAALAIASLFIYIGSAPRHHPGNAGTCVKRSSTYIFIPVVLGFMISSIIGNGLPVASVGRSSSPSALDSCPLLGPWV